jgi:hypothetical protein
VVSGEAQKFYPMPSPVCSAKSGRFVQIIASRDDKNAKASHLKFSSNDLYFYNLNIYALVAVSFYNVGADDPEEVWNWLTAGIQRLRENKTTRIKHLVAAARDFVINSDVAKTRQARRSIADTMQAFVERLRICRQWSGRPIRT